MKTRLLDAVLAVLTTYLLMCAQAHAQTAATSRGGAKVQPRFFNPFAVQNNVLTINVFGQISSTPFATQAENASASLNAVGQASALATAAASQGKGPPSQTPGNGPPSQTPGNVRVPFNLKPPHRPPARSPFEPPGPPFDPPGPPFDPPGPPPVVPPPFQ